MRYIDYDIVIEGDSIELDPELTGKLLPKLEWSEGDLWEMRIVGDVITLFKLEKE
jgi:hypothetical protein